MSPQEGTAWQVGADASEVLGPESGMFAQLDPVDFGSSMLSVARPRGRPPGRGRQRLAAVRRGGGRGGPGRGRPLARVGPRAAGTR